MNRDTFGRMILEMASVRDGLAKEASILESSNDHSDQEIAEMKRERIQGLHDAMRIAIRYFGNDSDGMEFEVWKSYNRENVDISRNVVYAANNASIEDMNRPLPS